MSPTSPPSALREGADRVARVLRDAGYQAYFAGGCVRDALLGVEPKDYDIATDARPEQVAGLFSRTIMVGAAFGVAKVVLGKGRDYEVATFRTDGTYSDGRRPDEVAYATSVKDDVERRDFTINALLMDPVDDRVIDYVGGREDLQAGLIRAVGDPQVRFQEDRLRMLRAVRFAARFGFDIERQTRAAIAAHAVHLTDVSVERITSEVEAIFRTRRPGLAFELMTDSGLLAPALPYMARRDPEGRRRVQDALSRLPEVAADLASSDRVLVGWALTLEGVGHADADGLLRGMKLSREQIRGVRTLLESQAALTAMAKPAGAEVMGWLDHPKAPVFAAFQAALLGADAPAAIALKQALEDLRARPLPKRPLVTGADLQGLGLKPGRHFKDLMDAVDREVLERKLQTKEAALAFVRTLIEGGETRS